MPCSASNRSLAASAARPSRLPEARHRERGNLEGGITALGGQRCGRFGFRDTIFGCFTHLLECTCLDLPDALPRNVELGREIFQCRWLLGQMLRLEDTTFALIEYANRVD